MSNKLTVRVFVPPTFEGVASVAVLEEIVNPDTVQLEIFYVTSFDFRDSVQRFQDAEMILILGLAYRGYNLPDEFYAAVDVPFMDFIHHSTYGEELKGEHIVSVVAEDVDPIKEFFKTLEQTHSSTLLSKHVTITDKARFLVDAINAYRTWTWETNNITRLLLALYNAGYKRMPYFIKGLSFQETVKQYAPIIQGQIEKMNDYIERKRATVKQRTVTIGGQPCILKVVYAEEYINELANDLLRREQTSMPVIICVGRTTKGSDLFSIRTSKVDAGSVAYMINAGGGKETVATVFSGVGYAELMGDGLAAQLEKAQTESE